MASLYENIGGAPAVDAAVNLFYDKVLADQLLTDFFDGLDMQRQRHMLKSFLTLAFGGDDSYSGESLRNAHARIVAERGLNNQHFDAVLGHLGATLDELGVPDNLIEEAAGIAESVRDDVLNH